MSKAEIWHGGQGILALLDVRVLDHRTQGSKGKSFG